MPFARINFVDTDGNWIGWLPWEDLEIVDASGEYLGTIESDRLYRFKINHIEDILAIRILQIILAIRVILTIRAAHFYPHLLRI